MLQDRFVPPDELSRITRGSYEQLIGQLAEEVARTSDRFFGQPCKTKLLSTFQNHAVVLAESGQAVRVRYEMNGEGRPMVVSHEPYKLQCIDEKNPSEFVEGRAREVVDALLEGDEARALSRARDVLPLVEDRKPVEVKDILKLVREHLERKCPWKAAYEENLGRIHQTIGSDLGAIDQRRVESKFEKLYDGSIPVEQRSGYADLVQSDLTGLVESYGRIEDRVGKLTNRFTAMAASPDSDLQALGGFALDFEEDVQRTSKVLREAAGELTDVAARGELHDVASKALYRYDVAVKYIEIATQDQG